MANICNNHFYAESGIDENLDYIQDFFLENVPYYDAYPEDVWIDIDFDSKWTFPEELMQKLFEGIPDKSEIIMRCLSVEYGNLYHALWFCDEDGWREV